MITPFFFSIADVVRERCVVVAAAVPPTRTRRYRKLTKIRPREINNHRQKQKKSTTLRNRKTATTTKARALLAPPMRRDGDGGGCFRPLSSSFHLLSKRRLLTHALSLLVRDERGISLTYPLSLLPLLRFTHSLADKCDVDGWRAARACALGTSSSSSLPALPAFADLQSTGVVRRSTSGAPIGA